MQSTIEWGGIGVLPKPRRGPMIKQRISADQPEVMCTTVPPAKSIALTAAVAIAYLVWDHEPHGLLAVEKTHAPDLAFDVLVLASNSTL